VHSSAPSATAQNVALARAHLTGAGILDDPYAAAMLRPRWALLYKALRLPVLSGAGRNRTFAWLAARTRFFDDAVCDALDAGIGQVVVLGAGYDSRAWRFARPGVRFFEVDHPATQVDKRSRAPAGGPAYVPVDLGTGSLPAALHTAGYQDLPTLFVAEGLTMYLTEPQVRDLLRALRELGPAGSRLAVNFGLGAVDASSRADAMLLRAQRAMSGERITFRPSQVVAGEVLAATGWTAGPMLTAPELVRHYLTGTGLPVDDVRPTAFAVTAN
jgi:methyltransferase (TIGR00027 family)